MKGCRFYAFLILVIIFLFASSVGYAKEIQFTNTGYEKERQVVYRLLAEDIKAAESLPHSDKERLGVHAQVEIKIAMEDLNNDGKQDMLVYVAQYPYFCGKEGCTFLILIENREGNWHKILEAISHEDIHISQHSTNGYNDIILSDESVYVWNGKNYKVKKKGSSWR